MTVQEIRVLAGTFRLSEGERERRRGKDADKEGEKQMEKHAGDGGR